MGELHVNQKVFQAFQQAVKKDGINKDELKDIKTAIFADGEYDAAEQQLVAELESRSSSPVTLIADGDGTRLEFNSSKVLSKKLSQSLEGWDQTSEQFGKAFESKMVDGALSAEDVAALRKSVKSPKDLELMATLSAAGGYGALIEAEGFPYHLTREGDSWKLDQDHVAMDVGQMAEKAIQQKPGSASRKQLIALLDHANPTVRRWALEVLNKRIFKNWDLMDDLKAGKIKTKRPEAFKELEQTRRHSVNESYRAWQRNLPDKLAELKDTSNPDTAQEAWLLAEALVFYEKTTDTPLDPKIRSEVKSQLQATLKEVLANKELPAKSQVYWLRAAFTLDPKGTAAALEKFLLNAPEPSDDEMELSYMAALGALLDYSPRADEVATKVIDAQGKSSRWVKETAVQYIKHHGQKLDAAAYEKMLLNPMESVRITALDKLAEIGTPATVKMLLEHYQRGPMAEDVWHAESLLKQLAESDHSATAKAARQALEVIAGIQGLSEQLGNQGPAQQLSTMLKALETPDLRKAALEQLIQLLEASPETDRQALLTQMASEGPTLGSDAAKLAEMVQQAYAGAGTSIEADLKHLAWLRDPAQQLRQLEAMIKAYPENAAELLEGLKHAQATGHDSRPLSESELIDFTRLRFKLDPEAALPELKALLAKLPPGADERMRALATVFASSPVSEQAQAWGRELLAGPDGGEAKIVADTMRSQDLRSRENWEALLASPHWEAEKLGLELTRDRIVADPSDGILFSVLEGHYLKQADAEGRRFIEGLMDDVAKSSQPIGREARDYLRHTAEERSRDIHTETPDESRERHSKQKMIGKGFTELEYTTDIDKVAKAMGIELDREDYMRMMMLGGLGDGQRGAIALVLLEKPGMLDAVAKYAPGFMKGEIAHWLLYLDAGEAREAVQKLLMSTTNVQDYNNLLTNLRGNWENPPNLKSFLGAEGFKAFEEHGEALKKFEEEFVRTNSSVMSNRDPVFKGEFMGKAMADYRDGKLSLNETREAMRRIILSFTTRQDYQTALDTMLKTQNISEDQLIRVIGEKPYQELHNGIGIRDSVTTYSDDEYLAREAQDFFDLVAKHVEQDGDLSYERLERRVPEIREHPLYHDYFGPYGGTTQHLKLAQLIADGKIQVGLVGANFVDRHLFGKYNPGIFELHGDQNLTNQLTDSVVDKAKQFVAVDKAARMIHDKTYELLHGKSQALLGLASDEAYLQTVLDGMKTFVADYKSELDAFTRDVQSAIEAPAKLKAKISEKLKQNGVTGKELSKRTDEIYEKLLSVQKTLDHYGGNAASAAEKMRDEAKKLEAMTYDLHVNDKYEDDRGQFLHYEAFAIYHGELDILRSVLDAELAKMGSTGEIAKGVLSRAEDLEDEIDFAKDVLTTAAELIPGVGEAIIAAKIISHGMNYYEGMEANELGLRSDEAQNHELMELAFEAISLGVSKGLDKAFAAVEKKVEQKVEREVEEALAKKLETEALDEVAQAEFKRELTEKMLEKAKMTVEFYHHIAKTGYEVFEAMAKGEKGTALSHLASALILSRIKGAGAAHAFETALVVAELVTEVSGKFADRKIESLSEFGDPEARPLPPEIQEQFELL
ncbi:MAG: hypothetical protein ACAI44_34650, partial [Candidatus Sericytochromatia bacterium]